MKSHRFPQILLLVVTTTCLFAATSLASDKPRKAPPPKSANQYAAFDPHPKEQVTVAAEPCDDVKDCDFFRLPYVSHGFVAVRVIFTNDSDTALSLDDVRIQFISANNDKIPAATDDDLNRRLFSTRSAKGTKVPLVPLTIHHTPVDKKITEDDTDFGFTTTTVQPHTTLAGYLFYDVRQLDEYPLKGAELYVKMVYTAPDKDGNKKQLFDFNIPFNKWLAAQSKPKPTTSNQ
ncbi:MAG TPA: hypothetical protein VHW70_16440 [Edaphobacter sp.]|nr:hypothetical protein [Edaphobacter sp.]